MSNVLSNSQFVLAYDTKRNGHVVIFSGSDGIRLNERQAGLLGNALIAMNKRDMAELKRLASEEW